tara:strand:- start:1627 stop:3477 length:1851 start_codon:yes stop_codon:yes gene_type:complete
MANNNVFKRLGQLFRSNIIIRKTDDNKLVVKDIDFSQSGLLSNFVDRYNRIMNAGYGMGKWSAAQNAKSAYEVARTELFRDYEIMDADPIISSALDIYSDESTVDNIEDEILNIKTDNKKIHEILHNLFYDIMNIEFNLWSWIRNMTKYGDFFLHLEILDKYGIVNIRPLSAYDVTRLEDHDPSNPKLVQFEVVSDVPAPGLINKENIYEDYEIAHFRFLSDSNYVPYGKSMIEGARRIWKQLTLMEDAMLIHRIMRAPEKRVFKIDIGNIPPNEVENLMQQFISKMKKVPVIDQKTGEYNLRYNIESVTEDFWLPVRGGDSGTEIETLPGLTNSDAIEDIEYLRNKMMAALRIPKAFLGYEEGVGSKATLAAEDVRFARTIERVQKIMCAELSKIAIVHLYTQGFNDSDLLDFELELTNPSMIHEQEKLELLTQQSDIASSLMENSMMSRNWIYDNIFDFDMHEKKKIFNDIIEDKKQEFRMEQIKMEGNDPMKTGEAMGTPHTLATLDPENKEPQDVEFGGDPDDWGGDRRSGTAEEDHNRGYSSKDVKNATKYERERYGKRQFKGGSPLYPGKGATIVKKEGLLKQLKKKFGKDVNSKGLLNEDSILSNENDK